MEDDASKALALAGRYARLQIRSSECKYLCGRLLDSCERPRHFGNGEDSGSSGCMCDYQEWKSEMNKGNVERPNSDKRWSELLVKDLEFCRSCLLAMRVFSHRKTMHRRRASVLGAIKRVGLRNKKPKATE